MQALVESAPKLIDFLGDASLAHFAGVRAVLDAAGLEYRINPRLVRGMDYYNLTVFEWVTDRLGCAGHGLRRRSLRPADRAARRQAGAGGRLGPRASSACCCCSKKPASSRPDARRMPMPCCRTRRSLPPAMRAVEALRAAGVSVLMHAGGGSMKSQFKRADASGARYALIFGDDELARGEVALKPLRDAASAADHAVAGRRGRLGAPNCASDNRALRSSHR